MYIMSVYKLNTLLVFYGEWLHSDAIFILRVHILGTCHFSIHHLFAIVW